MSKYINRSRELAMRAYNSGIEAILVTSIPNMRYFSGFTGDSGMLVITHNGQYLLSDFRYSEQAHTQSPDFEYIEFLRGSQYKECSALLEKLEIHSAGFESDSTSVTHYKKISKEICKELIPADDLMTEMRAIKDAEEISHIKRASAIADEAFMHILEIIKPGVCEIDIALELEYYMRKHGAQNASFAPIVASGQNGSRPHAIPTDKKVEYGELLTLDFGCTFEGYCSDMTRTIAIGKVAQEHIDVYNICLEAQRIASDTVRPGMTGAQVDMLARSHLEKNGYGECFGHALGHGVGIKIHEYPTLSPSSESLIKEGMVFSIEPGIYIRSKMGVRIEDIGVLQADGFKSLCTSPKHLIHI